MLRVCSPTDQLIQILGMSLHYCSPPNIVAQPSYGRSELFLCCRMNFFSNFSNFVHVIFCSLSGRLTNLPQARHCLTLFLWLSLETYFKSFSELTVCFYNVFFDD